ncbi:hypothetical protein FQZ97_960310 [compost metagenome]
MLQEHGLLWVGCQLDAGEYMRCPARQIDALQVGRRGRLATLQTKRVLAVGIGALIDVEDGFTPAIEHLPGVVASLDPGDIQAHTGVLVHRDPGFRVGDVEIGVGDVDRAALAVEQLVPLESILFEIHPLLAKDQQPAEQVDIRIADIRVADVRTDSGRRLANGDRSALCRIDGLIGACNQQEKCEGL